MCICARGGPRAAAGRARAGPERRGANQALEAANSVRKCRTCPWECTFGGAKTQDARLGGTDDRFSSSVISAGLVGCATWKWGQAFRLAAGLLPGVRRRREERRLKSRRQAKRLGPTWARPCARISCLLRGNHVAVHSCVAHPGLSGPTGLKKGSPSRLGRRAPEIHGGQVKPPAPPIARIKPSPTSLDFKRRQTCLR